MDIGKKIKEQRELSNWTQQELADKLSVSHVTISRYESNVREPDAQTLSLLADLFSITVDELLGRR